MAAIRGVVAGRDDPDGADEKRAPEAPKPLREKAVGTTKYSKNTKAEDPAETGGFIGSVRRCGFRHGTAATGSRRSGPWGTNGEGRTEGAHPLRSVTDPLLEDPGLEFRVYAVRAAGDQRAA